MIAENTRDEQRKFIKYNHLVANLLVFHNIVTLSRALNRLQSDDLKASDQALAALTPYQTEHIKVNFSRTPEPLPPALCKSAGVRIKGGPLSISQTYNSLTLCEDFVRIVLVGQIPPESGAFPKQILPISTLVSSYLAPRVLVHVLFGNQFKGHEILLLDGLALN